MKPIMTVTEARKTLGQEAESMTDEQIEQLIDDMHEMAKFALEVARRKVIEENRPTHNY